jgi:hypothetical protein
MNGDDLHDLLRQADQEAPGGRLAGEIVPRVRRKLQRRQAARTAVTGTIVALMIAGWIAWPIAGPMDGHPSAFVTAPAPPPPPVEESVRVAELTAADILLWRRHDQAVAVARQIDPLARLRVEIDEMNRMTGNFEGEIK